MTDNRRPENEPQGKGKNKLTRKEAEKGVKADTLKKKKEDKAAQPKQTGKGPKETGGGRKWGVGSRRAGRRRERKREEGWAVVF